MSQLDFGRMLIWCLVGIFILLIWYTIAYAEEGSASWYGPGFHGRKTANGEIYNQNAMTCAHKTRKLGTFVTVTRVDTGKSITCRINDRGPYVRGRVIDLSKAAASQLKMIGRGVVRVTVE